MLSAKPSLQGLGEGLEERRLAAVLPGQEGGVLLLHPAPLVGRAALCHGLRVAP